MSTAASTTTATSELQSSLHNLHIGEKASSIPDIPRPKLITSTKAPVVADSWVDELDESSEPEAQGELEDDIGPTLLNVTSFDNSQGTSPTVAESPLGPPPTPISPQTSQPWVAAAGGY